MPQTDDPPIAGVDYNAQSGFDSRFEWGANGVATLAPICDAIVIVDVLSFTTCVDIATTNGGAVYPYRWKDASAAVYAQSVGAIVANFDRDASGGYSLSPASLLALPRGARIVLPSPNGSALSLGTGLRATFAGCLRNASALAEYLANQPELRTVGVIAAGEKWPDGSLRPAIEDLIGAGAILSELRGRRSPEARLAVTAFENLSADLRSVLRDCSSGRELIGRGFATDVELAAALNASVSVPRLADGCYRDVRARIISRHFSTA